MSNLKPKRRPAWQILINAFMQGVRVEVNGNCYQYFRKGEVVDTVPPSKDHYEITENGFFMLHRVIMNNVEQPCKWMFMSDTITFVLDLAEYATDADLAIATANVVLNTSKRLRNV